MAPKMTAAALIASGQVRVTKEEGRAYRDDVKVAWRDDPEMRARHREATSDAPPKWLRPHTPPSQMTEKQRLAELGKQIRRLGRHEGLLPSEVVPAGQAEMFA